MGKIKSCLLIENKTINWKSRVTWQKASKLKFKNGYGNQWDDPKTQRTNSKASRPNAIINKKFGIISR